METPIVELQGQAGPEVRKPWDSPRIILERPLQVAAQGGPPKPPNGFIGPLSASGGSGTCGG